MKPILKYAGGKRKELANFQHYIPTDFNTYIEPFLGGGAVFFELEPKRAIINDINSRLMRFYRQVSSQYDELMIELKGLKDMYESSDIAERSTLYYKIRDMYNGRIPSPFLEGTIYYVINKLAYSGLTRTNSKGEFNVPFGKYQHLPIDAITIRHSELLRNSTKCNTDFETLFKVAKSNDFMFLDPPYDCVFHQYGNSTSGFGEDEHRRLAEAFKNVSCKALMVIGRTPLTTELYGKYVIDEYPVKYSVNIKNRFSGDASHIVVANYKIEH